MGVWPYVPIRSQICSMNSSAPYVISRSRDHHYQSASCSSTSKPLECLLNLFNGVHTLDDRLHSDPVLGLADVL
jgi:hypothetical protein